MAKKINALGATSGKPVSIFDLTDEQLVALRKQVVINSLFYNDYKNTFGVNTHQALGFFDGYVEYLFELAEEDGFPTDDCFDVFKKYDNAENLIAWRYCFDC